MAQPQVVQAVPVSSGNVAVVMGQPCSGQPVGMGGVPVAQAVPGQPCVVPVQPVPAYPPGYGGPPPPGAMVMHPSMLGGEAPPPGAPPGGRWVDAAYWSVARPV